MTAAVETAKPLVETLYDALAQSVDASPEGRAHLRHELASCADSIQDKILAAEYRRALLNRFDAADEVLELTDLSWITTAPDEASVLRREKINGTLLAIVLQWPEILEEVAEALLSVDLSTEFQMVRSSMLDWASSSPAGDAGDLASHLETNGAADLPGFASICATPIPPATDPTEAASAWWQTFEASLETSAAPRSGSQAPEDMATVARGLRSARKPLEVLPDKNRQ